MKPAHIFTLTRTPPGEDISVQEFSLEVDLMSNTHPPFVLFGPLSSIRGALHQGTFLPCSSLVGIITNPFPPPASVGASSLAARPLPKERRRRGGRGTIRHPDLPPFLPSRSFPSSSSNAVPPTSRLDTWKDSTAVGHELIDRWSGRGRHCQTSSLSTVMNGELTLGRSHAENEKTTQHSHVGSPANKHRGGKIPVAPSAHRTKGTELAYSVQPLLGRLEATPAPPARGA